MVLLALAVGAALGACSNQPDEKEAARRHELFEQQCQSSVEQAVHKTQLAMVNCKELGKCMGYGVARIVAEGDAIKYNPGDTIEGIDGTQRTYGAGYRLRDGGVYCLLTGDGKAFPYKAVPLDKIDSMLDGCRERDCDEKKGCKR